MAEALVSFLVSKLGDHVVQRISQYKEFKDGFNWLKEELSMMKASLKDADRRTSTSEAVKEWVAQLKHAAFRIEDVLDDMYIKCRCSNTIELGKAKLEFTSQFQSIKEEIQSIVRRGKDYGLLHAVEGVNETSGGRENHQVCRIHGDCFEEPEMVGFDEEMMKLRELTLREEKMMNRHNLISIVGMRGSGKSTLARNAYNLVKGYFDCHAWISVSKSFQMKDLLKHVYKGFCESRGDQQPPNKEMESLDERELKRMICTYLCGKRYALVLDDMYDLSVLDSLKSALPSDSKSKIIFTSPFMIYSLVNENCRFLIMNPLPLEAAWKLFCQKAFQYSNPPGVCPLYLRDLGHHIVTRCGGLPLAILLMGGIMSKKQSIPSEWIRVLDNFNMKSFVDPLLGSLNQILQASYEELPSQLKYCFLYCCTFPKSSTIKRNKLLRLWVAEGFIEKEGEKASEDIANDYYIQLIERSLLLPVISDFDGEPRASKVHDIMHEFGKTKFQEDFGIIGEGQCHRVEQKRRLVVHNARTTISPVGEHFKTRSLLLFNVNEFSLCPLTDIPSKFKYLRVMSLEGILMESLPNEVCDLIFLRYLGLRGTQIERLPNLFKKLVDLETLDLRGTRIRVFLGKIGTLEKLRHLLLPEIDTNDNFVMFGNRFSNLHTFSGVIGNQKSPRDVRSFPKLRRLHFTIHSHTRQKNWTSLDFMLKLCNFIGCHERLFSLKLYSLEIDRYGKQHIGRIYLENLSPPHYLEKLVLGGVMEQLPQWFDQLKSLRIVRLVNSLLVTDPLSNLSMLPNLVSLSLYHAYSGEHMGCQQGGFPKLRHLHMASLVEFTEWSPIEEGTMPCLRFLSIVDCTKLSMLPQGFEQLTSLQNLEVIEMPNAFMERLVMEDHLKVKYISKITYVPRTSDLPRNSLASTSSSA